MRRIIVTLALAASFVALTACERKPQRPETPCPKPSASLELPPVLAGFSGGGFRASTPSFRSLAPSFRSVPSIPARPMVAPSAPRPATPSAPARPLYSAPSAPAAPAASSSSPTSSIWFWMWLAQPHATAPAAPKKDCKDV